MVVCGVMGSCAIAGSASIAASARLARHALGFTEFTPFFQKFAGSYAAVSAALAAVWLSQNATASVIQPSASVPRPGPIL